MQKINMNFVLLLVGAAAALAGLSFWGQPPFDPDLGWHLFGGAFIATHHAAPSIDLINTFSPRWHDYHWLAQWGMYLVYQAFGYQGLSLALGLCSGFFALCLVFVAQQTQILKRSPLLTLLAIMLALFLMAKVTSVRPQVISISFLSLTLCLLKQRPSYFAEIVIFILAILAANVHVYWIFIPLLYALYRVLPALIFRDRMLFYRRGLFFTVLALAALISPYGIFHGAGGWIWENYALLFDYLVMPESVSNTIGELQSTFTLGKVTPLLICIYLMIMARGFRKSDLKTCLPDLLGALLSLILAVKATKFLAIFALLSFPYFLRTLFRVSRPFRIPFMRPRASFSTLFLSLICFFTLVRTFNLFPNPQKIENQLAENLPLVACEKIATLPLQPSQARDHIRVLTHFNYGGWCRWIIFEKAPERDLRVTIDGRTQWFPPEFFTKGIDVFNARYDWIATLNEWQPDVLLVQRDKPLASVLGLAKGNWHLEYEDAGFAVFTPIKPL